MSPDKKNIVLAVPTLSHGGAERVMSLWANELHRRGYHVSLLLFYRVSSEYSLDEGIPVHVVAENEAAFRSMGVFKRRNVLRALLRQLAPDTIISALPLMQALVMLASNGLGIERVDLLRNNPNHGRVHDNALYWMVWRACFRSSDRIIVQTSDQLRFLTNRERKKSRVVPNPLSERFSANEASDRTGALARCIAVGRLHPQKGYRMMVEAFAQAARKRDDISLRIFGAGQEAYERQLQEWIDKAGMQDRIHLMGWSDRMEEEYGDADVYLLSSEYEGMPNALMEAMASGLVCVSTDCDTGPRDLIENGVSGFLVPVGDESGFARAIAKALSLDANECAQMTSAARERVLEFCSLEGSVDALCQCIEE